MFNRQSSKAAAESDTAQKGDEARDRRDWSLAANHYRNYLQAVPKNDSIWIQLGHALKEIGDLSEAEKAYKTAIALVSDSPEAHLQLGHLLKVAGRVDEALLQYEIALHLDLTNIEIEREVLATRTRLNDALIARVLAGINERSVPAKSDDHPLQDRVNAISWQVEHILGHVAITKALAFQVAKLGSQIRKIGPQAE